jgi:hypothetical protein
MFSVVFFDSSINRAYLHTAKSKYPLLLLLWNDSGAVSARGIGLWMETSPRSAKKGYFDFAPVSV